jgi:hypothetical protein
MFRPFALTPVLTKSWLYDPYDRFLVSEIRRGRYRTELFDGNSLILDYPGRMDANADLASFGTVIPSPVEKALARRGDGVNSRPPLTEEEKAARKARMQAMQAIREREALAKAARAEKDRVEREAALVWLARREKRETADREWDEAAREARKVEREASARRLRESLAPLAKASAKNAMIRAAQNGMAAIKDGRPDEGMDTMAKAGWTWLVRGYASKAFAASVQGCGEGELMGFDVLDSDGEKDREVMRWRAEARRGEGAQRIEVTDLASRRTEVWEMADAD